MDMILRELKEGLDISRMIEEGDEKYKYCKMVGSLQATIKLAIRMIENTKGE